MSHNGPNDVQPGTSTAAEGENLDLLTTIYYYYAWLNESAQQAGPENPSYVQPSLTAPSGTGMPPHPSPPYPGPSEDPHPSQDPRRHTPDPFATATQLGLEHLFHPQIPPRTPKVFPPPTVRTEARGIGYAASSTDGHRAPSEPTRPPGSVASAPAQGSKTQRSVTGGATPPTAPGAPGPSTLVVLEEITQSPELPVVSSCDFGGILTLGDALKKDFSQISRDSASRAFPSNHFAGKMAFWHLVRIFNRDLRKVFRPRRKQVTVVTTRKSIMQQPSKARLAYLVAREMEKYLKECNLRQTPFPYTLDDIILRRIDLVSKGTLRPRLYVHVRQPRPVRSSTSAATC
ncbi:hypothetical protein LXA43DRAFT_1041395 [Ganoderma leucocontextum]|nr:hypothetical protein LXA43DRAFT_1041395 [Ganoderma leucocontextum]